MPATAFRRVLVATLAAATLLVTATPALAQTVPYSSTPLDGWDTDGVVRAVKVVGDTVWIGGSFTRVRPPSGAAVARANLAAIDRVTGAVKPFRADTNGRVAALESDGTTVWAGGYFTSVRGTARRRLAALDATTGAVRTGFSADASSTVLALELSGPTLYVGGYFGSIRGVPRPRLAAVVAATGAVRTAFRPAPDGSVLSLVATGAGDRLYAGGSFTGIGGTSRAYVAGLDPVTGAAAGPALADVAGRGMSVDVSQDGQTVFAGLGDKGNRAIAWRTSNGSRRWYRVAMGDVQAVRYHAGNLYFGFHEGYQGDTSVRLLAADATTGTLEAFRPSVNSFYGVWAIDATDDALVAGGEFTRVSGVWTQGVAVLPA